MQMAARIERMSPKLDHYKGLTKRVNGKAVWTGKLALAPESTLLLPLRTKKPTMWFVNSMSDLFHEDVPDEWIDRVFAVMALTPQHTYQVLTKRSGRMREYVSGLGQSSTTPDRITQLAFSIGANVRGYRGSGGLCGRPLPNVWLGVSAERQQEADERIPDLLATPAAVRFVSAEPLLGPIDFARLGDATFRLNAFTGEAEHTLGFKDRTRGRLDWIIVGGESGPNARPMHPDWARSIRDQCAAAGVPFFFKQWGRWALFADGDADPDPRLDHRDDWMLVDLDGGLDAPDGRWPMKEYGECAMVPVTKSRAGRLLDGREHNEMPGGRP